MVNVAFSWDDGAVEDLKMMDLMLKYDIPGIFFVPAINNERKVIHINDVRRLFENNFEIGAHTYSHLYLTDLMPEDAEEEIYRGKVYLQDSIGEKISHFCFPGGKFNSDLVTISKKYFSSARTADTGAMMTGNSFLIKPSFHFYNRGKISILYNSFKNNLTLFNTTVSLVNKDYFSLIECVILKLAHSNRFFNVIIWGHSWEIEKYGLWKYLESFFILINNEIGLRKCSYSGLLNSRIGK